MFIKRLKYNLSIYYYSSRLYKTKTEIKINKKETVSTTNSSVCRHMYSDCIQWMKANRQHALQTVAPNMTAYWIPNRETVGSKSDKSAVLVLLEHLCIMFYIEVYVNEQV